MNGACRICAEPNVRRCSGSTPLWRSVQSRIIAHSRKPKKDFVKCLRGRRNKHMRRQVYSGFAHVAASHPKLPHFHRTVTEWVASDRQEFRGGGRRVASFCRGAEQRVSGESESGPSRSPRLQPEADFPLQIRCRSSEVDHQLNVRS
jgi:hypothetical protein